MEYVLPQNLNGPHRSVAAKTVDSIQLLRQGLEHLQQNIGQFSYKKTNFLTELHALCVDDLHVPIHHKNQVTNVLQYTWLGKRLWSELKKQLPDRRMASPRNMVSAS